MLNVGSRRNRDDRGAAAVEFALVVPVLLLLLLGIIEFTFFLRDYSGVASAVRVGARTASSGADAGDAQCPASLVGCRPGDLPNLAVGAVAAIEKSGLALGDDAIDEIWIFKANDLGFPGLATTPGQMMQQDCITNPAQDLRCIKYTRVLGVLQPTAGAWNANSIDACIEDPDAVGVYVQATHRFMTGFFGATSTISDRAVLAFEPLSPETCGPGKR